MKSLGVVFVFAAMSTSAQAWPNACDVLEAWNIEMDAAQQSLSPDTRDFLEVENPALVKMVDEPKRLMDQNSWVAIACDVESFAKPSRPTEPSEKSPRDH